MGVGAEGGGQKEESPFLDLMSPCPLHPPTPHLPTPQLPVGLDQMVPGPQIIQALLIDFLAGKSVAVYSQWVYQH